MTTTRSCSIGRAIMSKHGASDIHTTAGCRGTNTSDRSGACKIELLKLQKHSKRTGGRHVIVFEGRDAAGKGGTIQRFMEHLNPRSARVVALERFAIRLVDAVRQWKFSPMDMESINRWDDYTEAKEAMFGATDTDIAPWIVVSCNDKKRARINAMRFVLAKSDYDDKDDEVVGEPDPLIVGRALTD
jgi:polyphosphate kinase 2 (PPK2 family)